MAPVGDVTPPVGERAASSARAEAASRAARTVNAIARPDRDISTPAGCHGCAATNLPPFRDAMNRRSRAARQTVALQGRTHDDLPAERKRSPRGPSMHLARRRGTVLRAFAHPTLATLAAFPSPSAT